MLQDPASRAGEGSGLPGTAESLLSHSNNANDSNNAPPPAKSKAKAKSKRSTAPEAAPEAAPAAAPAAAEPPTKRTKNPKKTEHAFVPPLAFSDSVRKRVTDDPVQAGMELAYFMDLPPAMGGRDWFVGKVLRMSRSAWADVHFPDGKLWLAVKESERGARWVALAP
uniref:Uncharacterized protein n=1 Tax=Haptolina brevifila TaxID=156173 RepID=A0A7S2FNL6_9EUKA|mmetsp:Transcript_14886/g.29931  ORF Transcript_14886/g.29931 Transcript_14886/m.29931 type:complete len:167 (+) Transcript_14886:97-597(+)